MLHPSYSELMEYLNKETDIDSKVTSRYTIVIAAAKRARQIINGAQVHAGASTDKAVSIAVNEMYGGKVKIKAAIGSQSDNIKIGEAVENQFSEA